MKNYINNFVARYKAILMIKKDQYFASKKSNVVKDVTLSTLLIVLVFGGLALVFGLSKNIHYVFISVNIIIVGSFIIYKVLRERKLQHTHDLEYSTWLAVSYDIAYFIGILSIVQSILILFLFMKVLSILLLIFVLLIGIFANGYVYLMYSRIIELESYQSNMFVTSLWLISLYVSLFYVLDIRSIALGYIIVTAMVSLLYFYRLHLRTKNSFISSLSAYTLLLFGAIFFRYAVLSYDRADYVNKTPFLSATLEYGDALSDIYNADFFEFQDHIFYQKDGRLFEYDNAMQFLQEWTPSLSNIQYYFATDDTLYVVTSLYPDKPIDGMLRYEAILYDITDKNAPIQVSSYLQNTRDNVEMMISIDNQLFQIQTGYNDKLILSPIDGDSIYPYEFEDGEILYQTPSIIVYVLDQNFYMLRNQQSGYSILNKVYSNGKYLYTSSKESCIVDVTDDFLWDESSVQCFNQDWSYLSGFYYDMNHYYFLVRYQDARDRVLKVYTKNLKLIEEARDVENFYFTQDLFIASKVNSTTLYDEDGNANGIETIESFFTINPNNLVHYEINGVSPFANNYAFLIGILIIFSLPINLPLFKGGDYR